MERNFYSVLQFSFPGLNKKKKEVFISLSIFWFPEIALFIQPYTLLFT